MKVISCFFPLLLLVSSTAIASTQSDKAIREILTVTHARNIIDAVRNQIDYSVAKIAERALNGKPPTDKQKRIIADYKNTANALLDKNLTWKKIEASDIRIYKETFTDKEIQGILSFYKSPAGQAFIKKMPAVSHKRLGEIQLIVSSIEPQLQKISSDYISKLEASDSKADKPAP